VYIGVLTLWWSEALIVIGCFGISMSLANWVGEGLTTVFFFPVGLDVRRGLTIGELCQRRRADPVRVLCPLAASGQPRVVIDPNMSVV
jgi:Na+/H+ antiporter NhaA